MPNITIYLPEGLAEECKKADMNISKICQEALSCELKGTPKLKAIECQTGSCYGTVIWDSEEHIFRCKNCNTVYER